MWAWQEGRAALATATRGDASWESPCGPGLTGHSRGDSLPGSVAGWGVGGHAAGGRSQQGISEAPAHPPVGGKALLQLLQDQSLHHVICFCHQVRGRRFC